MKYLNMYKEIDLLLGDSLFLPGQREELLYGTILKSISSGPLVDIPLIISLPGKAFILKSAFINRQKQHEVLNRSRLRSIR